MSIQEIRKQAEEIIFGQLRQVLASMGIEEINRDRDTFLQHIQHSLEPELNKVGLQLINVNITDITDESGYIDAIGQKAASQAVQKARGDVADNERMGEIRVAGAEREFQEPTSDTSALYSVECGQVNDAGEPYCYVDRDTYVGWRTYHGFCHVCHAQDAVGSTFAPNLLDRMREMDMDLFVERVNNGFTGQVGVMPPWKDDPNVRKRYKELYAYLKARASDDLPPGRPKPKPKSN